MAKKKTGKKAATKKPASKPPKKTAKVVAMEKASDKSNGQSEPLSNFQKPKTGRKMNDEPTNAGKQTALFGTIELKKIKLRDDLFLSIEFIRILDDGKIRNPATEDCNWIVDKDLKEKFAAFRSHIAVILEYVEVSKVKDIRKFNGSVVDSFVCNQVSLGSKEDGVTLTGRHILSNKKSFNFNAPYTQFSGEKSPYKFGEDLEQAWNDLIDETILYINGKHGKAPQQELQFDAATEPIVETDI